MNIPFTKPTYLGSEDRYVLEVMRGAKMSGDGPFGQKCQAWFEKELPCSKALLTPSCTHALEMGALLANIQPGDEVIMPSYTFVSTANAFVLRGAHIVFVDIEPNSMNMDAQLIEEAITSRTRAIVPVHYAGVGCDMDTIMRLANQHQLVVIEDAAQGVMASYKGQALGTIGHVGAFSFHDTKNYTSGGEGGLLILNDSDYAQRSEIIREKGTNRKQFFRGMVDKYSWVDIGSSYLPSELQAAYLWAQLEQIEHISQARMKSWQLYRQELEKVVEIAPLHADREHNAHMFYIKLQDQEQRAALISHLKTHGIQTAFHYVPLHSSVAGKEFGHFHGTDRYTTKESERLLRLPLWHGISQEEISYTCEHIRKFLSES